jgi:ribA/ribD-fused uncharacterized protein
MTDEPLDVDALRAQVRAGARPKYLRFWGHTPAHEGRVGKECLSQWYPAPFDDGGTRYASAEHYMMAAKARLFGDEETARRVLAAPHPHAAKKLGREVRGFDEATWAAHRFAIVVAGSAAKFAQNAALGAFLSGTRGRVLVEASPVDRVWGIGLADDDPRTEDPDAWPGLNLLGFALMVARARLY